MEFLAEASAELDAALDLDETLQRLADLTVPRLGDGCMVDLLEETGGSAGRVGAKDPAARAVLERLQEETIELDSPHPIAMAIRTGQLQRVDEHRRGHAPHVDRDESYLDAVRDWPGRAAVVAPMRARGRTLGAIARRLVHEAALRRRRRRA